VSQVKIRVWPKAPAARRSAGISLRDAARTWKVSHATIYRLEAEGHLDGIEVGNRVYYSEAQLRRALGEPGNDSGGPERSPSPVWAALSA